MKTYPPVIPRLAQNASASYLRALEDVWVGDYLTISPAGCRRVHNSDTCVVDGMALASVKKGDTLWVQTVGYASIPIEALRS